MIDKSSFAAYYFFAGCTMICTVVCALYMVETKGHTLEVIEQRYMDEKANSTGRWTFEGFKLKPVTKVTTTACQGASRPESLEAQA